MSGGVFKEGCNPEKILEAFCSSRRVNADGSWTSKDGVGLGRLWEHLLASYLKDDQHVIERFTALSSFANKRQDWPIAAFSRAYRQALLDINHQREKYVVVFPLSGQIQIAGILGYATNRNTKIVYRATTKMEKKIEVARPKQISDLRVANYFEARLKYSSGCQIQIHVNAINPSHAHALAKERVDELLGILAFCSNQYISRYRSGMRMPISDLLIAPPVTVHDQSGALALDAFWHDGWEGSPKAATISDKKLAAIAERFKLYHSSVLRSKWKEDCKRVFRMFNQFCCELNTKTAFLMGWQILEYMIGGERATYDVVVARASRFYQNGSSEVIRATYFKDVRNSIAHGSSALIYEDDDILYQIKEFLRPIVAQYIRNPYSLVSKQEFVEFCESISEIEDVEEQLKNLKRQTRVMKSAKTFLSP